MSVDATRRAAILRIAASAAAAPVLGATVPRQDQPGARLEVTPEMFGAVGDGSHDDTVAWQSALRTGGIICPRAGATYLISRSLQSKTGEALVIRGQAVRGLGKVVLQASQAFTGYLLQPDGAYDVRDICLVGNGRDGCYLFGSDKPGSATFAILDTVDLRSADILINFGAQWEHPLLLSYHRIYGQHFRTAGIVLGGLDGDARSGESAWSFDTVAITNAGQDGIPPSGGVTIDRSSAINDAVRWSSNDTPLFGWLVMRSQDGRTGWHVPPNWTPEARHGREFQASKVPAERWSYAVVRQTVGMSLRRAKAVSGGVVQTEYCGVGLLLTGIIGFSLQAIYYENRDRFPNPAPALAAIVASKSFGTINTGWVEKASYGIIVRDRSSVEVGTLLGHDLGLTLSAYSDGDEKSLYIRRGLINGEASERSTPLL